MEKDQHIPEEQAEAQLIQSLRDVYRAHAQDVQDLAEVRARLHEIIRARSASGIHSLLPGSDGSINGHAGDKGSKPQVTRTLPESARRARELPQRAYKNHRQALAHGFESLAAVLVVLSLVLGWLILLPRLRPASLPARHTLRATPTIQLPQTIQVTQQPGIGTFLAENLGSVYLPAWTSDSRYLSFVDGMGNAYVWNVAKKTLMRTISLPGTASPDPFVTWNRAPGGRYLIAFTQRTQIQVWDVIMGQSLLDGTIGCFAWSTDGTHLALSNNSTLQLWDLAPRKLLLSRPTGAGCPLSWSPDGRRLLMPSLNNQGVSVVDTTTGSVLWTKDFPPSVSSLIPAWSPNGQRLATLVEAGATGDNTSQQIWDAVTGQQLSETNLAGNPEQFLWSQDGVHLLSVTSKEVVIWNAVTEQTTLQLSNPASSSPSYPGLSMLSPNGERLEVEDGGSTVQIWDLETGKKVSTYQHSSNLIQGAIDWSPNSQSLVSAGEDGRVDVWNVSTRRVLHSYAFSWGPASQLSTTAELAWSPDGRMIAIVSDRSITAVVGSPPT